MSSTRAERVRAIELRARNDAHRLIEECMILANVAVAQELEKTRTPTLYRIHGKPEEQKLDKLLATLTALGIEAQIPENVSTRDLQAITKRLGHSAERPFVESLVVRSMPQALYQPTNIGHFGLALTHYAHFTSPIRRYPDLVVHRTLKALIEAPGGSGVKYDSDELAVLGDSTSKLEKRADEADRYVNTSSSARTCESELDRPSMGSLLLSWSSAASCRFSMFRWMVCCILTRCGMTIRDGRRRPSVDRTPHGTTTRHRSADQSHGYGGEPDRRAHRPGAGRRCLRGPRQP